MTAPVTYSLAAGIAQRHVASTYRMHLGTQHLHPLDVRVLTLHISGTHEHLTLHAHQRTDRCRRHTMLSGSCLCDDTRLAHLLGQQDLAHGVVDLVGARVVQVLALQLESATIT